MYAPQMAFVIRTENGVLGTRDSFEEARRLALLNATVEPVIEDEDGNVVARMVFTPDE